MITRNAVDTHGMRCTTNTTTQNARMPMSMPAPDTEPDPANVTDPASMKLLSSPITASMTQNATSESPSSRNASRYDPRGASFRRPPAPVPAAPARSARRTYRAHSTMTTRAAQLATARAPPDRPESTDDVTMFTSMLSAICVTMARGSWQASTSTHTSDSMTDATPSSTPGTMSARSDGIHENTPNRAHRFAATNSAAGAT